MSRAMNAFLPAIFAGTLAASAMACTAGPPADDARPNDTALADTLTRVIADAYDFSHPDVLARMNALYPDTGRVISASAGRIISSADSLRAGIASFWNQAGRNMRDAKWQWHEVHVDRLSRDAAVLTATWSIPHIAPDSNPHNIAGAWTAVFRRINGEWKIVQEHLSTP